LDNSAGRGSESLPNSVRPTIEAVVEASDRITQTEDVTVALFALRDNRGTMSPEILAGARSETALQSDTDAANCGGCWS
jgi:hypothetical protein